MANKSYPNASVSVSRAEPAIQAKSVDKESLIREIINKGEYNRDQLSNILERIERLRGAVIGHNPADGAKTSDGIWPSGSLHEVSAMHDVHCNLLYDIGTHLTALESALI